VSAPTYTHLKAAKRVLSYLRGTEYLGLKYKQLKDNSVTKLRLTAYCDADWGGDLDDRKSTTGYCVFINDNLVCWNTKKQPTVAQSTAEAELMGITDVCKDVCWWRMLIGEIGYSVELPVIIHVDNQAAIKICTNDTDHDRTKHIDIKHYFVRDLIIKREIELKWIPTDKQLADMFTKALGTQLFIRNRDAIMCSIPTHTNTQNINNNNKENG
jgi:hypothetical protein